MLKRAICLLLVLMMAHGTAWAVEAASDDFVFFGQIAWNTTPDEAADLLGASVQRASEGMFEVIQSRGIEAYGVAGAQVTLVAIEDLLCTMICVLPEGGVPDERLFIDALSEHFGDPRIYGAQEMPLSDLATGMKTLCRWDVDGNTCVMLVRESENAGNYYLTADNAEREEPLLRAFSGDAE